MGKQELNVLVFMKMRDKLNLYQKSLGYLLEV